MSPPQHFHVITRLPKEARLLNLRVHPQTRAKLQALATTHRCSVSEIVRQMIHFCLSDGKEER